MAPMYTPACHTGGTKFALSWTTRPTISLQYTSGAEAWLRPDPVFQSILQSRSAEFAVIGRMSVRCKVYRDNQLLHKGTHWSKPRLSCGSYTASKEHTKKEGNIFTFWYLNDLPRAPLFCSSETSILRTTKQSCNFGFCTENSTCTRRWPLSSFLSASASIQAPSPAVWSRLRGIPCWKILK